MSLEKYEIYFESEITQDTFEYKTRITDTQTGEIMGIVESSFLNNFKPGSLESEVNFSIDIYNLLRSDTSKS